MDEPHEKIFDIRERAFRFSVRIVKLCKYLDDHKLANRLMINQLLDAGTSVGANLEEANAGQSGKDFVHKNAIALKEARESKYWLRLVLATTELDESSRAGVDELEQEALELSKIIGKIIVNKKIDSKD